MIDSAPGKYFYWKLIGSSVSIDDDITDNTRYYHFTSLDFTGAL